MNASAPSPRADLSLPLFDPAVANESRAARSNGPTLRLKLYASLVLLDSIMLLVSFLAGTFVRFHDVYDQSGIELIAAITPTYFVVALNMGAYTFAILKSPTTSARRSFGALVAGVAAALGIVFYAKAGNEFSRLTLGYSFSFALLLLPSARLLFGRYIYRRFHAQFEQTIILSDGVKVDFQDATLIDVRQAGLVPTLDDPTLLDRTGRLLRDADRVIVACEPIRRLAWANTLRGLGRSVEMLAPELDDLGALGISRFAETRTAVVSIGPLGLRDRVLKRMFDIAAASLLLAVLSPALIIIAALIKLDSTGPVLFRQPRIGRGNRIFLVYKFRTMRTESCDPSAGALTRRDDDRVTRIGKFLRRSSLDEIPQLFNVLEGNMSMVGPRPHALGALAGDLLYWEVDTNYWARHSVKPGITGLAQVRGHRGTTFLPEDLQRRLHADLEYLIGWSIWRDISILFATFRVIFHRDAF